MRRSLFLVLAVVACTAGSALADVVKAIPVADNLAVIHALSAITGGSQSITTIDAGSLTSLAIRYENAEGVARDYSKAHELYCAAAKAGDANAQYALGWMYTNGRGVARDDNMAAYLFSLAASQGHEPARNMVRLTPATTTVAPLRCLLPDPVVVAASPVMEDLGPPTVFPKGRIFNMVGKVSPQYEVDPQLVMAFIKVESGFNEKAVSPKNAQGLMQLIPDTARRFRVKDVFDPEQNIKGGTAYLQWLLAYFRGNVQLVAAAYNAGERAVDRYRGVPPYPETRDYVKRITALYKKTTHPYLSKITEPSTLLPLAQVQPK